MTEGRLHHSAAKPLNLKITDLPLTRQVISLEITCRVGDKSGQHQFYCNNFVHYVEFSWQEMEQSRGRILTELSSIKTFYI